MIALQGIQNGHAINDSVVFSFNGAEYAPDNVPPYLSIYDCIKKDENGHCFGAVDS